MLDEQRYLFSMQQNWAHCKHCLEALYRRQTHVKGNYRQNKTHAEHRFEKAEVCPFCEEEGHKMAKCPSFLNLLRKCVWCGEHSHESHQCEKRPRGEGYYTGECVNSINLFMQSRNEPSKGRAYFANVTVSDGQVSAMVDNGASLCLISESVVNNNVYL